MHLIDLFYKNLYAEPEQSGVVLKRWAFVGFDKQHYVYLLLNPRQHRHSVSDRMSWFVSARCECFFSWPGEWQLCYSLKRQLFLDLCWEELVFSTVKCEWKNDRDTRRITAKQRGFSLISHAWHTLECVKRAHWVTVQKRHPRCIIKRSSANLRSCGGKQPQLTFCFERSWG